MRRIFFSLFLALSVLAPQAHALDRLVEILAAGVTNDIGSPLVSGTVTFYDAGTTNLRTVYTDFALSAPASNPATLDSAGRIVVFTDKRIKVLIKDSLGSTVRTIDNVGTSDSDVAASAVSGGLTTAFPVGSIIAYVGASAPTGWLMCAGAQVLQSTYASLYAVIGTQFNTGAEAPGFFRLPAQARRTLVGAGGGGTATLAAIVGSKGGEETHVLTAGESGTTAHTHTVTVTDPGHIHAITDPTHAHNLQETWANGGSATGNHISGNPVNNNSGLAQLDGGGATTAVATGVTVNSGTTGITAAANAAAAASAGSAHNNMQPSLVVNYIIKY